ncbi:3-mercaptopyruvate sulfurtransferase [Zavarzinia sp. CC-PAN008]|uniref:3-mercaptopyruvate sulfurtransferase n=1 Tax=Zavarzinia sp. CC-PAN008 TaxID=3243332 RepID=UPI003F74A31A
MSTHRSDAVVSTEWLAQRLTAPDVRIIDASWYLPQEGRSGRQEYEEAHIPGAQFFDLDDLSDEASPYPHMLPAPEKFASRMRRMGLGDGSLIVIYDGGPLLGAARAWWMFRAFGHGDVAVLDGGLAKWKAEGRPLTDERPPSRERHFTARLNSLMVRDLDQMHTNLKTGREQVVDARARGRFEGTEPEPRAGLRPGHIPGSASVPYKSVLAPDGTLLRGDDMRAVFHDAGIDPVKPLVATCGSGVSAAVLLLALHTIGARRTALYDGSWAEWGAQPWTPVAVGPAGGES